jgi:hypothetical protein
MGTNTATYINSAYSGHQKIKNLQDSSKTHSVHIPLLPFTYWGEFHHLGLVFVNIKGVFNYVVIFLKLYGIWVQITTQMWSPYGVKNGIWNSPWVSFKSWWTGDMCTQPGTSIQSSRPTRLGYHSWLHPGLPGVLCHFETAIWMKLAE